MTRKLFLSLVSSVVSLCMQPVLAQGPAGGGAHPSTPPGQAQGVNGRAIPNSSDAMAAKVDDKKFAKDAALGGMAEVELGKLADSKGLQGRYQTVRTKSGRRSHEGQ